MFLESKMALFGGGLMAKTKKTGATGARMMAVTGKKAMQAPIKPGRVYSAPSGSKKSMGGKKGKC
jgi:hypothetical protein